MLYPCFILHHICCTYLFNVEFQVSPSLCALVPVAFLPIDDRGPYGPFELSKLWHFCDNLEKLIAELKTKKNSLLNHLA